MENKSSVISVLDKVLLGCAILFLVSTNNSIFLNQLGYYGALLCIIAEYFLGKNKFRKTGLELVFLLFILAEFLSAVFSVNHPQAFQNLLKRFLLIPIVYMVLGAADNTEKAKMFFKVYLGAALLTISVYLIFAYKYFIARLYVVEGKGPSLFQYVMTAGGLISFTSLFMFALLINEKTRLKVKFLYLAGFIVTIIALLASDTRAAWIGTAAGILIILLIKRKWVILAPVLIIFIVAVFVQKTKSNVYIYSVKDGRLSKEAEFPTEGRASYIYNEDGSFYLSDFQNGVVKYNGTVIKSKFEASFPVLTFLQWKDDFYLARLLDNRMVVYRKVSGQMNRVKEFASPGLLTGYEMKNSCLYTADSDSGLTVYYNPENIKQIVRFPEITHIKRLSVDSAYLSVFTSENRLQVYTLKNKMPDVKIYDEVRPTEYGYMSLIDDKLFFNDGKELNLFHLTKGGITPLDSSSILKDVWTLAIAEGKLLGVDSKGEIYELDYPLDSKIKIRTTYSLPFAPAFMSFYEGKFYITQVKLNRFGSIVDPYHITNVERLHLWHAGLLMLKDHPFFGVGDIDMQPVYIKYRNYYDKETFGHLHNNYVHLLAVLGIPGFIIVMVMLVSILVVHMKAYKSLKHIEFVSSYSLGALACFVGFLVSGLAEWNFGDHEIITMVWFTLGLNLAFYYSSKKGDEVKDSREETLTH